MRRRALPALAAVQGSVAPSPQMAALFMGGGEDDDGTCVCACVCTCVRGPSTLHSLWPPLASSFFLFSNCPAVDLRPVAPPTGR